MGCHRSREIGCTNAELRNEHSRYRAEIRFRGRFSAKIGDKQFSLDLIPKLRLWPKNAKLICSVRLEKIRQFSTRIGQESTARLLRCLPNCRNDLDFSY